MPENFCPASQPKTFDIVNSPLAGINLIDASAGTGKTYTICGLVLRLILETDLTIEQILVVTYTEAATEDLRDRIRQQLRQALDFFHAPTDDEFLRNYLGRISDHEQAARRLSNSLRGFDEAAIYTIHGFCQRMLHENSFESDILFDTELVADHSYLVKEIIEDFLRREFSRHSDLFSQYAAEKLTPEELQNFLRPLLPHPFLRFIPAIAYETGCTMLSDTEIEYLEAYINVCKIWTANRSEICRDLQHSPRLKRNTYNKTAITGLIAAIDEMTSAIPSPDLFDKFDLVTASRIITGTKVNETPHILPFYQYCEILLQARKKLLADYDNCLLALKNKLLDSLPHELDLRKKRENIFSFEDLLRRLHKALSGPNGPFLAQSIARKYPAALIDEFQDTDPLQYEIFKAIYRRDSLLFLIGDPKQAIYSFRGADIHTYMDAAAESELAHHTLGVNYRSDSQLVKAVNTLFCRVPDPFVYKTISFQPVAAAQKPEPEILTIDGRQKEPFIIRYLERKAALGKPLSSQVQNAKISKTRARDLIISLVTAEIARLLQLTSENRVCINNKRLVSGDVAILVRTNDEARKMQKALAELQIPSVLHSGEDLFTSEEAKEMKLLLEAVASPGNMRRLKRALLTRFIGLQADGINQLQSGSDMHEKSIELWLSRFRIYHELWQRFGFIQMFWSVLQENSVRQRILAGENGERILTNLLHLAEILHHEAVNQGLNMASLLGYLQDQLSGAETRNMEHQLRLESDDDRIKIVTIHKAKGLEYPVVFCPFTWEGSKLKTRKECIFHQPTPDNRTELIYDAGSSDLDDHLLRARQEEMAENLRLLYVAITRAVHRCYLYWGPINGAETSAPAYLLHQNISGTNNSAEGTKNPNILMEKTANRFIEMADHDILADLQNLAAAADGSIKISTGAELQENYLPGFKEQPSGLQCRHFTGRIPQDWKISSFSALIARQTPFRQKKSILQDEAPDRDAVPASLPGSEAAAKEQNNKYDIFSFPQGAKPGTLLHELLEQADFSLEQAVPESLINEKLRYFRYETTWSPVLAEMLDNLGNILLLEDVPDLKLCNVSPDKVLHELEFYFPLAPLKADDLKGIFCSLNLPGSPENAPAFMARQLERLTFAPARGYMRGFIDLVFSFDGKFYLADWKSNHLGSGIENYRQDKLLESIFSGFYFLQYHLYCLALHLYLGNRLPSYEYGSHFGGVFYVFLRGVNRNRGPEYGIYHDLPTRSTIETLCDALIEK